MNQEQGIITPIRLPHEPEIKGSCLLLINPFEAHYAATITKKKGGRLHHLFHAQLMAFAEEAPFSYWAGPAVGAPMAVLTLEKLIALGCRKIVVMGWCGSLVPELKVGDIFLPTWGQSEEGVSAHYPLPCRAQAAASLRSRLQDHFPEAVQGPIWTTDAPYRELPSKIKKFAGQGIKGVDMEFSALCTVAAFRQIDLAAVMLVSDELYHESWQPGYTSKTFKKKSHALFDHLSSLLPCL
ncbi:MAG: nucleoside phosphorylase [Desulfurivibrionaceae bacterium]|nr:nucleoside phosphorylase [Desulfurivibrionaceae bacterium]